jgi:hypothetical protein
LVTQRNEDTSKITLNQRFVFGGIPNKVKGQLYEVYAFKTFMDDDACNERLLGLEMRRLNNNDGTDDLYNNIANIYRKDWYKIDLNEKDITQAVGFSKEMQYQVYKDNDIVDLAVKWESSNPQVAIVDSNNILSIIGVGKTVITCHLADNDNVKAQVIVSGTMKHKLPEKSEYVINPLNLDVILLDDEQTITFYHTVDEVPDKETFNVKLSGVPFTGKYTDYYFTIESDSGNLTKCNSITITNNREFTKGRLLIEITSNKTGELIGSLNIRLGGIL